MNKRLLVRGSLRTLNRYRLRSFFMGLGIVVGVAALVVMRSVGSGAQQDMLAKIERLFSAGSIWIVNSSAAMQGGIQKLGQLSLEDVAALGDEIEEIIDVSPILSTGGIEVSSPLANRTSLVIGTTEREEYVGERSVVSGEFFTAAEVRSSARVALIGLTAAEALFGDEDPVGQQIQIAGAPFRIKGVLERFGADPHGMDRDDEIHVPITTLMRRIVNMDTISRVKVLVSSTEVVEPTVDRIVDVLRARHGLSDDTPDDFALYTPTQVQELVKEANRVVTVYLPATAGVALVVAALVIANIMLLSVRERIPEIGLRKALGATDRQISGQFLLEGLVVALISALLGVGLGAAALETLGHMSGTGARMTPDSAMLGFVAAMVVGVSAAFFPARQAARQEPVDALR
jgi:putative ABC transport system permease protein